MIHPTSQHYNITIYVTRPTQPHSPSFSKERAPGRCCGSASETLAFVRHPRCRRDGATTHFSSFSRFCHRPPIADYLPLAYNASENSASKQVIMAQSSLQPYTVALAQINVTLGDQETNLAKHLQYVEQ